MVNLLYDEVLFSFKHREGAVKSISFLTDSGLELSLMASTCYHSGAITLWDLNAKKIWAVMPAPHGTRDVTHLDFMQNEPILVSASEDDNSIKMWHFEKG
jgi:U3 small nucleolar RNA-associated protein 21